MKILIKFTLDIDPEAWSEEYGVPLDEVRADVRAHAMHSVHQHFESLGLIANPQIATWPE